MMWYFLDRQILVGAGYGTVGKPTCNVLPAPAVYASAANDECLTQNVDEANRILDDAGWMRGGDGVRAKDGVRLSNPLPDLDTREYPEWVRMNAWDSELWNAADWHR